LHQQLIEQNWLNRAIHWAGKTLVCVGIRDACKATNLKYSIPGENVCMLFSVLNPSQHYWGCNIVDGKTWRGLTYKQFNKNQGQKPEPELLQSG